MEVLQDLRGDTRLGEVRVVEDDGGEDGERQVAGPLGARLRVLVDLVDEEEAEDSGSVCRRQPVRGRHGCGVCRHSSSPCALRPRRPWSGWTDRSAAGLPGRGCSSAGERRSLADADGATADAPSSVGRRSVEDGGGHELLEVAAVPPRELQLLGAAEVQLDVELDGEADAAEDLLGGGRRGRGRSGKRRAWPSAPAWPRSCPRLEPRPPRATSTSAPSSVGGTRRPGSGPGPGRRRAACRTGAGPWRTAR